MKKKLHIIGLLFVLALFVQCGEDGSIGLVEFGNLTGKVVKKSNFEPLENVKITLSPSNNTTFTDADGNFSFTGIEAQDYSVQAAKDGYLDKFEGATVNKENAVNVVLEMEISTALNQAPTKPNLLTPSDGTIDLNNVVNLTWESTDPDGDELTFVIELRNDIDSEVKKYEDIKELAFELTDLKFGVKYFWQVLASDGINQPVSSSVFSFTVKEDPGNRFFYVRNENGNSVIYSGSFNAQNGSAINEIRLTSENANSWRPRKSNAAGLIAFLRTDSNEAHIFTMKANGNDVQKVTSSVPVAGFNLNEMDFSWSPNGDKLIYPSFGKLYMINKDGTGLQMIYETTDGSLISECDWSEDGSTIALKTNDSNGYNGSIFTIDVNGNVLNTVVSGVIGALGGLNLSASGNQLLYARDISDFQSANYRQLDTRVFIYNFTTMMNTPVSADQKTAGTNDLDPRFSPNEAEVIFMNTSNDGISQMNVVKTNLAGNIQRVELFQNASMPDWE
ncbi:conserved exported protein of unknown function [Tenacibaculum sp. 190130A14a]|uniref:Fibronectin type-III domain-containing protein n=1 Tax=Tenacibaculum polynesiense TaxID=3137857 RepID=A0ABP1EXQ6_9FLAO